MLTIKLCICSLVNSEKLCIPKPTISKIALKEKDALLIAFSTYRAKVLSDLTSPNFKTLMVVLYPVGI